ncbi:hypothetical protein ABZT28_52765, partial [Streptomyces sp. NPDC005388]
MKQALGLAHFEGRTWGGWHHHVTLVSVAHAFCTLQRLARAPKDPRLVRGPQVPAGLHLQPPGRHPFDQGDDAGPL